MTATLDWSRAFARQAEADFNTWESLQGRRIPECHKLLFLQMACEKVCKAHLIVSDKHALRAVQKSHGFIEAPLPRVLKQQLVNQQRTIGNIRDLQRSIKHIAKEIEALNPSMDDGGRRPENCEYPWEDHGGVVHSPLDWDFNPSSLLLEPNGRTFLKLLRLSIDDLLQ